MAADKELIKGINMMLAGKEEGFNVLYSKTYNYVYGRAKMIMKDEEDALDLTQETFIQAYKNIHTLEDVNNIYAWLGGIVYRHGMKIFRKKRDLLVNEDAEGIFEDIVSEDRDFRPEESAEEKATSNVIMSMIQELPELQKAALLAFYYDNMKIDDIAAIFDCSSNTIKSRLNYAKKYLKDKVEAHEKAYAYRLHSVSPAVIILAFKSLFATEQYTMTAAVAQGVYNAACTTIGFAPAAIATAEAVMTSATTGGATATTATTSATTAATTAASSTATATTVGAGVAKAGMALGTKIAIGIATVATAGVLGVGGMYIANNLGLFGSQEEEVYREGDIVTSVDEYYELLAEYAEDGVTDFEIYVLNPGTLSSLELNDPIRLQKEYGVTAGIRAEHVWSEEVNEDGGRPAETVLIDGEEYYVIEGELKHGENVYVTDTMEGYRSCLYEALSKKQETFYIYTLYVDKGISEEVVMQYNLDYRMEELQAKLEADYPANKGESILKEFAVEGIVLSDFRTVAGDYPMYIYGVQEFRVDINTISDLELEEDVKKDWSKLEGVYLYSPDFHRAQGGGFRVTVSNVQGARTEQDVEFDVLFETYSDLDDREHSVKIQGHVDGFVDGVAKISGTTTDGTIWDVEMCFLKDMNAVHCDVDKTTDGNTVGMGYHGATIATKTCEEMKDVRNLFDEGDTTFVGTSANGITYQIEVLDAETLEAVDGKTGEDLSWQHPGFKLTITSGETVLEYSRSGKEFKGLIRTFYTQGFDYNSDFMGYFILLEDGNLLFSVDALVEDYDAMSCEEPIILYKQ